MQFVALVISIIAIIMVSRYRKEYYESEKELYRIIHELSKKVEAKSETREEPKQTEVITESVEQPVTPPTPIPTPPTPTPTPVRVQNYKQEKDNNFENKFGKNAMGIVATILIFIGVIAFGTLVFTKVTDTIKVVGMFIASFATVGIGLFFTRKAKTAFSEILTGCGMGMTFISLFITHLYYEFIDDITTFVLIFCWSVAVSFISKTFKLNSLSYIALIGCVISSIFSLTSGLASDKFIEITVYHILTFVLLIISNKRNVPLFKASSFASIILNTILSGMIFAHEKPDGPLLALCLVLAIYNIAIYIYSSKESLADVQLDNAFSNMLHFISVFVAFCLPVKSIVSNVFLSNPDNAQSLQAYIFLPIVFITVAVSYVFYGLFVTNTEKRIFSLIFSEAFLAFLLLINPLHIADNMFVSFLIFPIFNIILYKATRNGKPKESNTIFTFGFVMIFVECLLSIINMYNFRYIGIPYAAVLIGLASYYAYTKYQNVLFFPALQSLIFNINFLIAALFLANEIDLDYNIPLTLIVGCNIAYTFYCNVFKRTDAISALVMEYVESILAVILMLRAGVTKEDYLVSSCVLSLVVIALALIKIKTVVEQKSASTSVWYGIKFTFFTFVFFENFFSLSNQAFIFSLFFMIIAAICIVFGFANELKALRIYGLVLMMTSVFKMVVIDVWNHNSLIRVFSLIAGGIICFAISAAYSRFEKKQKTMPKTEPDTILE